MSDYDFLTNLKGKIHELKVRRDQINGEVMTDRIRQTQLDDQIAQLDRER
jgi:hypothetical protein